MLRILATLAAISACSSTPDAPAPVVAPVVLADAGVDGITTIGAYDPASGAHLDDDGSGAPVVRAKATRTGRPIEVTLRSSPPGAEAYVDGVKLGPTPAFWQGEANGRDHEFAFTMKAHA
nr:PEGA domain-containing protein [Deltaproteobacteria bacterium]